MDYEIKKISHLDECSCCKKEFRNSSICGDCLKSGETEEKKYEITRRRKRDTHPSKKIERKDI